MCHFCEENPCLEKYELKAFISKWAKQFRKFSSLLQLGFALI